MGLYNMAVNGKGKFMFSEYVKIWELVNVMWESNFEFSMQDLSKTMDSQYTG